MRSELHRLHCRDHTIDWGRTRRHRATAASAVVVVPVALAGRLGRLSGLGWLIGLVGVVTGAGWTEIVGAGWAARHPATASSVERWSETVGYVGGVWGALAIVLLVVGVLARRYTKSRGYWLARIPVPIEYELSVRSSAEVVRAAIVRRGPDLGPSGRLRLDREDVSVELGPVDDAMAVIDEFVEVAADFDTVCEDADERWLEGVSGWLVDRRTAERILAERTTKRVRMGGYQPISQHLSLYVETRRDPVAV